MKKYLLIFMTGIIFLNALAANDVSAQTLKAIRAEVPFDFQVGDKTYAAGTYRLETISQLNENVLQLQGADKKNQRLLVTDTLYANKRQSPKLVFYKLGDKYYLSNIFMAEGLAGFSIRMSRSKLENNQKLASGKKVEVPARN